MLGRGSLLQLCLWFVTACAKQPGQCAGSMAQDTSLMARRAALQRGDRKPVAHPAEELVQAGTTVGNATLHANATSKATLHANSSAGYERQLAGSENETRCKACVDSEEELNVALRDARQAHTSAQQLAIALADAAEDHEAAAQGFVQHRDAYGELKRELEQLPTYSASKSDFEQLVMRAQELYVRAQRVQNAERQKDDNQTLVDSTRSAYDKNASAALLADVRVAEKQVAKDEACNYSLGTSPPVASTTPPVVSTTSPVVSAIGCKLMCHAGKYFENYGGNCDTEKHYTGWNFNSGGDYQILEDECEARPFKSLQWYYSWCGGRRGSSMFIDGSDHNGGWTQIGYGTIDAASCGVHNMSNVHIDSSYNGERYNWWRLRHRSNTAGHGALIGWIKIIS